MENKNWERSKSLESINLLKARYYNQHQIISDLFCLMGSLKAESFIKEIINLTFRFTLNAQVFRWI